MGLAGIIGAVQAGAERIIAIDLNLNKFTIEKQLGATECINPSDHAAPVREVLIELTDEGVDYSFECIGNVDVMRAALEACHKRWGDPTIIGVGGTKAIKACFYALEINPSRWQVCCSDSPQDFLLARSDY